MRWALALICFVASCKGDNVRVNSSASCTDAGSGSAACGSEGVGGDAEALSVDGGQDSDGADIGPLPRDSGEQTDPYDGSRSDSCTGCTTPDTGADGETGPTDAGDVALVPGPSPTYGDGSGRQWPGQYGQPHLCLWKGDAVSALSISIDDNTAPDHDWWEQQGEAYGYRFTWFVVAGNVDSPSSSFQGTWEGFNHLFSLGHDVQSHTLSHLTGDYDIETEYRDSKELIEEKVPGARCLTLAYPGGGAIENDVEVAKKYYIGARGVTGVLNQVDDIDYMQTGSISRFNYPTDHWASITNTVVYNPDQANQYRAWYVMHFHSIADRTDEVIEGFDFIKDHASDIWLGLFREVSLYGQQRETATVHTPLISEQRIRLEIIDEMDDALFDYPLTLKVRLNDSWTGIEATQAGRATEAEIVTHEGNTYALVSVVPDRGPATLVRVP